MTRPPLLPDGAPGHPLDTLPPGCTGKPHACHQGALAAGGEWLLFTDADTIHTPDGPGTVVAYAMAQGLDGLSLFLDQECRNLSPARSPWRPRLPVSLPDCRRVQPC